MSIWPPILAQCAVLTLEISSNGQLATRRDIDIQSLKWVKTKMCWLIVFMKIKKIGEKYEFFNMLKYDQREYQQNNYSKISLSITIWSLSLCFVTEDCLVKWTLGSHWRCYLSTVFATGLPIQISEWGLTVGWNLGWGILLGIGALLTMNDKKKILRLNM